MEYLSSIMLPFGFCTIAVFLFRNSFFSKVLLDKDISGYLRPVLGNNNIVLARYDTSIGLTNL